MITSVLVAILLLTIILWHYWCVKWSRAAKLINLIPGPPTLPLLGNIPLFNVPQEQAWNVFREQARIYSPIFKLWSHSSSFVVLCDPEDLQILLTSKTHIGKSKFYEYFKPAFGDGLIVSKGVKWQTRRKMLNPSFHMNILQEFLRTFIKEAEDLSQRMRKAGELTEKDLNGFCGEYTLKVLCETMMGISTKEKQEYRVNYRETIRNILFRISYRYFRPWFHYDFIYHLSPKGFEQTNLVRRTHIFTNSIIQERKKYHDATNGIYLRGITTSDEMSERDQEEKEIFYERRKRKLALLDLLIAAQREGNQIDDEGIEEEINVFLVAGYDTNAATLTFLLLRLAQHKEIQDRAREEVIEIFQKYEGKLSMSALQEMEYLERCIKETLRLHPSGPYIGRHLKEDLQLKKYLIPAGTDVLIPIYDIHRDPKYWPNPEVFEPDRFLPANWEARHRFAYIPFSAGQRNCIGKKYAMTNIKVLTSYLLKNFYLESIDRVEDLSIDFSIVLGIEKPVQIKFVPIL